MDNRQAIKTQVKGFLTPIFIEKNPVTGEDLNGLDPESFELVRTGYACAKCLAIFDTYTITCPVCGLQRDLGRDLAEAPALWEEHLNERNSDTPTPRRRINPAEAIEAAARGEYSENMETVPVSKMRRRRRG